MYRCVLLVLAVVACATLVAAGPAAAQRKHRAGMGRMDRTFVSRAAEGGMAEVELGRLASEKGESTAIKDFGNRMVTDHTKANDELRTLASSRGLSVPAALSGRDRKMRERLSRLSGDGFDRAYIAQMVKDHEHDVAEFRHEANGGSDPDVREWARRTLPTLEEHLRMAREAQGATRMEEHRGHKR